MKGIEAKHAVWYLGEYLSSDKWTMADLEHGDQDQQLRALRDIAGYYRVIRNFPVQDDEHKNPRRRLYAALALLNAKANVNEINYEDQVWALGHELRLAYPRESVVSSGEAERCATSAGDGCISAASKFLWQRFPEFIPIYDTLAWSGLRKLRQENYLHRDAPHWYARYARNWHESYKDLSQSIDEACAGIRNAAKECLGDCGQTLIEFGSQERFKRRIFDGYLMDIGADAQEKQ